MDRLKTRQRLAKMSTEGLAPIVSTPITIQEDDDPSAGRLAAKIRSQSILNESIPNMGYAPRKVKSSITKQEIEEFQQKENTPIEINGSFYRLHPAIIPEPDLEEAPSQADVQTSMDVRSQAGTEINTLIVAIRQKRADLSRNTQLMTALDEQYNAAVGNLEERLRTSNKNKKVMRQVANEYNFEETYRNNKQALTDQRQEIISTLDQLKARLEELKADVDEYEEELPEALAKIKGMRERNKAKIRAYEDNLRTLNRTFNLTQEQGESEEDYLARIKVQTEAVADPSLVVDRFNLYEARIFKENLRELIRDNATVEYAYNALFQEDEGSIPELNKIFTLVKSRYQKLYGTVQLKDEALVKFLKRMMEDPVEIVVEEELQGETADMSSKYNALLKRGRFTKKQLIEAIQNIIDYRDDPVKVMVKGKEAVLSMGARGGLSYTYNGKVKVIANAEKDVLIAFFVLLMETVKVKDPALYGRLNEQLNVRTNTEYGEGIQEKLPKFCRLGKCDVNLHKLFYKNVLSITHNGYKIPGAKNTPVSDEFVKLVMDLCKGVYPSTKDLNKLSPMEMQTFDSLLYLAGLHKRVENTADKTIPKLKKRIELIGGEIQAGNTNTLLKDELRDIVYKLYHMNEITQNAASDYLKQFR
jgi:hypothetical protein